MFIKANNSSLNLNFCIYFFFYLSPSKFYVGTSLGMPGVDSPLILDDHGPQNYNPQPFLEGMWVAVLRYLTNHPHWKWFNHTSCGACVLITRVLENQDVSWFLEWDNNCQSNWHTWALQCAYKVNWLLALLRVPTILFLFGVFTQLSWKVHLNYFCATSKGKSTPSHICLAQDFSTTGDFSPGDKGVAPICPVVKWIL